MTVGHRTEVPIVDHGHLHPFRSTSQAEFDIVDTLLTHLPALWAAAPDGQPTGVRDAWDALCGLGVGGLLVPPDCGGQGASLSHSLSVAWALSRIPAPVPFVPAAVIAPLLATALGERALLSEIATGDTVVAVAFGGRVAGEGEWGTTLHGEATDVLHGGDADRWLVVARTVEDKMSVVSVDRPAATTRERRADRTRPTARVTFAGVPARLVAENAEPLVEEVLRRAHLVRCVEVLAAASVAAGDDPVTAGSITAALTAVRSAAAATDLHGRCERSQLVLADNRTATVARLVRARHGRHDLPQPTRTRLCVHRATGDPGWIPQVS